MKLRDHPGMSYHGVANWPPVWTKKAELEIDTMRGEVGTLEYVFANERISNKCFLVMRHDGMRYVGCLVFNDRSFCRQMTHLLRQQLGRTIHDIGDLDLTATF